MYQSNRRLCPRRVGALVVGVALLAGGAVGSLPEAQAATISDAPDESWVANGDVNTVFQAGGRIFLGGSFDQIGPSTGSGVPLDPATGARVAAFPEVNGPVYVAVADGAGGWYIGGDFTRVGDRSRHNAARILADGTLGAWNPNTDFAVRAIVLAKGPGANVAWIGGDFTVINDASTPVAARGLAATNLYNGSAVWGLPGTGTGSVLALALSADGSRLLAGGDFTILGGVARSRLAAIDPLSGMIDPAFNPGANGAVRAMAGVPDGRLFVGGDFTHIAGRAHARLAALTSAGTADPSWQADADGRVSALALSADGARLYAGGDFSHAGGATRTRLAALSTAGAGAVDPAWNPGATGHLADGEVRAVALSPDGNRLYAGGGQDNSSPDMFAAPGRLLLAIDATTGTVDAGFDPRPAAAIMALAASAAAVYAGGQFTSVNGLRRSNLAALHAASGAVDTGFVADTDGAVFAVTSDGVGVYAGGVFNTVNGVTRRRLARVDAVTGAVSAAWDASASAKVQSLALAGDRLYVGGAFSTLGGVPRNRLGRVALSTGAVDAWNPNLDSGVHRIRLTADQRLVYVAGDFSTIGSTPRQRLAAIDATTGLPTGWHPKVQVPLTSIALSADASLAFAATRGGNIIGNRLQAWSTVTGALVWDRPGDGDFQAVDTSASFVYTGGHFGIVAGQVRGHLAAFDQQTGAIQAWAPTISGVHGVLDLQVTAGSILVAGEFQKVSGAVAEGFARFASDDPPLGSPTTTTTTPPATGPDPTTPTTAPGGGGTTRPGDGANSASARSGYWMVGAGGTVYSFGDARWLGSATVPAGGAAVDLEPTPSGAGYWVVDGRGTVSSFGDAGRFGSVSGRLVAGETVTSLSATPTGKGYWIFTTKGRVVTFGDAGSFGDMAAVRLNGAVLDSIPTPSGRGYYMVASDGGIFAFGDARFHGSMGGVRLNAPVQSLVPDSDGAGYWLVASDGGIFAFDAPFRGSMGGTKLNKPVTGMVRFGDGYLMVGEDGGIFSFSNQSFSGSLGANPPARPIVSVAAL